MQLVLKDFLCRVLMHSLQVDEYLLDFLVELDVVGDVCCLVVTGAERELQLGKVGCDSLESVLQVETEPGVV